jgi:Icc-related predicted phosphoesterase
VPCYGVPGNHDKLRPAGLNNLHGRVVTVNGVRIAGIGGARKYKTHPNHYTDLQMNRTMLRLPLADLIIAHSPPLATSQKEDPIHQGFACFDRYIKKYRPQAWIHGHTGKKFTGSVESTAVYGVNVRRPLILEFDLTARPESKLKGFITNLWP